MSFMKNIKVDKQFIGEDHSVFIIAELGINHNGDIQIAKELINAAKKAGADAIKFQTFRTEEFMSDKNVEYSYFENGIQKTEKMYDMFKRLELPYHWHKELYDYAYNVGVIPFTSIADLKSYEFLKTINNPIIKLASEDLINIDLLKGIADSEEPVILSTGMADEKEIDIALKILKNKKDIILLHCVSLYPTPIENLNLKRMKILSDKFGLITGFSDHSRSLISGAAAVSMGAKIIEKHFTLDRKMTGPDHSVSLDPSEMTIYIKNIREAELMFGRGNISPEEEEKKASINFRRGITLAQDMKKGMLIKKENIVFQRPCPELKPYEEVIILGKKLKYDLKKGTKLRKSDIE